MIVRHIQFFKWIGRTMISWKIILAFPTAGGWLGHLSQPWSLLVSRTYTLMNPHFSLCQDFVDSIVCDVIPILTTGGDFLLCKFQEAIDLPRSIFWPLVLNVAVKHLEMKVGLDDKSENMNYETHCCLLFCLRCLKMNSHFCSFMENSNGFPVIVMLDLQVDLRVEHEILTSRYHTRDNQIKKKWNLCQHTNSQACQSMLTLLLKIWDRAVKEQKRRGMDVCCYLTWCPNNTIIVIFKRNTTKH